jgi:hypothetical protein
LIEKIRKSHDAIVMDTHLDSPYGLEVAKKTRPKKDGPKDSISYNDSKRKYSKECLETAGMKDKDFLIMSFRLS